ncbi:unnamed protein product [Caenorhabditis auriculariae]|uniref:Sidoreflexin n=1 Tax=Caenorhabditis auriculariae TaxID=2777116 RepID=A0A8S1HR33_9PELO|nr:unnamed protein product [Caenorhabditis auriculariae]
MSDYVLDQTRLPDINKPRWDQSTFEGRARHFFSTANPLNLFVSEAELEKSRRIITHYKNGVFDPKLKVEELWRAKRLYDSAYHPDTGEKMFLLGRMSAQVPCNMLITGLLLTMYRSFPGVVFSHWINQTFNASVNYTNRSGNSQASNQRLFVSYCCATSGAMAAALGLNSLVKNPHGLAARLVPFAAIALANAINIPMMRSNEIRDGIDLEDDAGKVVGKSQKYAVIGISQVTMSRIGMALPYMVMTPIIMNRVAQTAFYKRRTWISLPLQTFLCGIGLAFTTPLCCAFFEQKCPVLVSQLEKSSREAVQKLPNPPTVVWYNKGL